MEVLFENTHVRNKALAKEFYGYLIFKKPLRIVINVLLLLSMVANVVTFIISGDIVGTFFLALLLYIYQIIQYFSLTSAMIKRDQEAMGGEVTVRTEVTDTYMQQMVDNGTAGAVNKMELSSIRKAVQTKNLILVFTKARLVWIFRKDAFAARSKDEFLAFLRGKGIKVR